MPPLGLVCWVLAHWEHLQESSNSADQVRHRRSSEHGLVQDACYCERSMLIQAGRSPVARCATSLCETACAGGGHLCKLHTQAKCRPQGVRCRQKYAAHIAFCNPSALPDRPRGGAGTAVKGDACRPDECIPKTSSAPGLCYW